MLAVTLSGLVVGRGDRPLTPPLDLTVPAGAALEVTGRNGAGKSTLLRTLAGLLPPLAGRAIVSGATAPDGEPATTLREACHYLGHRNGLKPQATLAANLAFWRDYPGPSGDAVPVALERLGLSGLQHIPVAYLSAGQQRRAALCRLIVSARPLWLLDEPVTALDAAAQERFRAVANAHLERGGIIIAATHHPLGVANQRELRVAPPTLSDVYDAEPGEPWTW